MKFLAKFLPAFASAAVIAAFMLAYSFLPLATPSKYSSPDEASNAYFSTLYAETGALWSFSWLTIPTNGMTIPRSMRVADGFIVPGGFLGLPVLYGSVGRLIGTEAMPFITPALAALAALAWGATVGSRFGRRIGLLAGGLLLVQPVWWYEASRVMQPNALFCALLVFATYFFVAAPFKTMLERRQIEGRPLLRYSDAALAGVFLAFSLAVRMAEAHWIMLALLAYVIAQKGRVPWRRLAVAGVVAAIAFLPFLQLNQAAYGSWLATGYGAAATGASAVVGGGKGNALLGPLRPYLFPLGFAPRTALANAWTYGLAFFWWWTLIVLAGIAVTFAWRKRLDDATRANAKTFGIVASVIALWLVFFYGSWTVTDSPDPNAVSIGSSYFRYWLPVMALSTVPAAWALSALGDRFAAGRRRAAFFAVSLALVAAASGCAVFRGHGEGLLAVRHAVIADSALAAQAVAATSKDGIIVVDYFDKYIYPDRPVVVPLRADATYAALPKIARHGTLYYFGLTLPEQDFAYLRDVKLVPNGLMPVVVQTFGDHTLYEFQRMGEDAASEVDPTKPTDPDLLQ